MRRRGQFAELAKTLDPKAYESSHNPLGYNAGPLVIDHPMERGTLQGVKWVDATPEVPRETPVKTPFAGDCPRCGKYFHRGLHFHVKYCGTKDEKKALGKRDDWLKDVK